VSTAHTRFRLLPLVALAVAFAATTLGVSVAIAAELRPPTVRITSGPQGVIADTSVVFAFKGTGYSRLLCRLDSRPWKRCSRSVKYEGLAQGPHTFRVRAYALSGNGYVVAKRSFVIVAPLPTQASA
jgi:hypothetical protein